MAWSRRWVADDAFIDFRVARNIVAGAGPVFNIDERVEAYTNPLWVMLLALAQGLGARIELAAVWMSLALALIGLTAAIVAAARIEPRGAGPLVPFGAVLFVSVSAVWDFSTSGLETTMGFAWLGITYALLAGRLRAPTDRGSAAAAAWIGLGPLVRPDLGVFAVTFLLTLILTSPRRLSPRRVLVPAGAALALPLAYSIFRMGYFAALVPNTAIAKEAAEANWSQGILYLADFIGTYQLWLPAFAVGGLVLAQLAARLGRRDRKGAAVVAAPLAAACVHALFVTRVGGDFMHARFLLPSLFGGLLPVMALRWPEPGASRAGRRALAGAVAVALAWAAVAMIAFRTTELEAASGITDERRWYAGCSGRANPVRAEDFEGCGFVEDVRQIEKFRVRDRTRPAPAPDTGALSPEPHAHSLLVDQQDDYLITQETPPEVHAYRLGEQVDPRIDFVLGRSNIGVTGWSFGPDVHLVDRFGLADPIAARLRLAERGRPGHEKNLVNAWIVARYAAPDASSDPAALDARAALACGDLRELLDAVSQPLTLARFGRNVRLAPRLSALRIPPDPHEARTTLCGSVAER
jgi:arabinofuranosyltransferase